MNILYLTTNIELAKSKAKEFAEENELEWYEFQNNKENMKNIISLYENNDDCVIFLEGITKSNISNSLLKILEEVQKNIHMFATTSSYDINIALQSRFEVYYLDTLEDNDSTEFVKTKKATKDQYSKLSFYIDLAKLVIAKKINMYHNIPLINDIVKNIKRTTNNTPWDYYYDILQDKFRW